MCSCLRSNLKSAELVSLVPGAFSLVRRTNTAHRPGKRCFLDLSSKAGSKLFLRGVLIRVDIHMDKGKKLPYYNGTIFLRAMRNVSVQGWAAQD